MPEDRIVDLRDYLPADITFVLPDGEWTMPGDVDNETVWRIYALLLDVADLPDDMTGLRPPERRKTLERAQELDGHLADLLLGQFRRRHPDLQELPFLSRGSRLVAAELLKQLGFYQEPDKDEPVDPTTEPEPPRPSSGSSTTGSGRSSRSSASRRTK